MDYRRWLVIPCKVPGNNDEPLSIDEIRLRFLRPGSVKWYWEDVTHNHLRIDFILIDQWLTPTFDLSGYPGSGNSMRVPFYNACVSAEKSREQPALGNFDGILVFMNAAFDLWGSPGMVMCDVNSDHNDLAHEVGHGLALDHTYGSASPAVLSVPFSEQGRSPYAFTPDSYQGREYGDRSDIMSVNDVWSSLERQGPGACAPLLISMGAIAKRVRWMQPGERRLAATLSPLADRYGPPAVLAFSVDHGGQSFQYFAELRLQAGWDAGFPNAGIVVHERRPDGRISRLYNERSDPDAIAAFSPFGTTPPLGQTSPPLRTGESLSDPPRRIRVTVLDVNSASREATVDVEIGADPRPFEQRFRAVNARASELGFVGAFPNFHEAEYGPGIHCDAVLLSEPAAERRDISASELGRPETFEQRITAVHVWAVNHGFASGFPNFQEADHGNGRVYGTVLIRKGFAEWRDIPAKTLGGPDSPVLRFVRVNEWSVANGYMGAYPTFQEAVYGPVFGTILLKQGSAESRDLPGGDFVTGTTFEQRIAAVNTWATQHGYAGGFPTFFPPDFDPGHRQGVVLIAASAADRIDIPSAELNNPSTAAARFTAVNDWAAAHGYKSGFPNFHQANYGAGTVYGAVLIKQGFAEWRDVPGPFINDGSDPGERFRRAHLYAIANRFAGAFPNFHQADYGRVYGTILVPHPSGQKVTFRSPELNYPVGHAERFRQVDIHAGDRGYFSGFPTLQDKDRGRGTVFGTISFRRDAADWQNLSRGELGYPTTLEGRFIGADSWAVRNKYAGAFPNFFEADYGRGPEYGTILIKAEAAERRDIPASELKFPVITHEDRFRAMNDWADDHGFLSAFPNFHQAVYDGNLVYGAILIRKGFAEWQDAPLSELVFR